jgi:hypothetical protein
MVSVLTPASSSPAAAARAPDAPNAGVETTLYDDSTSASCSSVHMSTYKWAEEVGTVGRIRGDVSRLSPNRAPVGFADHVGTYSAALPVGRQRGEARVSNGSWERLTVEEYVPAAAASFA